ncbi:hypothetical protein ACTVBU_10795 [Sanguibacter sp. A246]|uniref:hypothetical protein n=1 Tax=Sanguibacter sp. A246 TaxID=3457326 RepID=UPI003FD7CD65
MATYAFTLVVDGIAVSDYDRIQNLYSDELELIVASVDGLTQIDFIVDACDSEHAVKRALDHLAVDPAINVVRIDVDLVNTPEIADRLDRGREAVRLWISGARRAGEAFPTHYAVVGNQKVWTWSSVHAWALNARLIDDEFDRPLDERCVVWMNGQLALRAGGGSPRVLPLREFLDKRFVPTNDQVRGAVVGFRVDLRRWEGGYGGPEFEAVGEGLVATVLGRKSVRA